MRPSHIVVLVIVILIVFGASKLPDIARSIGQSAKVLKKEMRDLSEDDVQQNQQNPNVPGAPSQDYPIHGQQGRPSNWHQPPGGYQQYPQQQGQQGQSDPNGPGNNPAN